MPTNKLTDAACKGAKPTGTAKKLFDGGGLFLYISPVGGKLWRMAYRLNGKPKTLTFGPYPAVTLGEARAKRDLAKSQLRDGVDPNADKRKRPTLTFEQAATEYIKSRLDLSESYLCNLRRGLEMHIYPTLGQMEITQISREALLDVLRRMDAAGRHVYVRKVRLWTSQVFEWAVENGDATANPAATIRPEKAFTRASIEHFPALSPAQSRELWQRLDLENDLSSVIACKLLALTWLRTGELRMIHWSDIDTASSLLTIPAGRMKRRRDHLVPLSTAALELISKMYERRNGSEYVFPAEHRHDRPMSENAVLYLLYRMGYRGRMTGHGWRTVASTWANDNAYNRDAIERQLAHAPDDRVRAAYNRAEYLPERRKMLQDWAEWLINPL